MKFSKSKNHKCSPISNSLDLKSHRSGNIRFCFFKVLCADHSNDIKSEKPSKRMFEFNAGINVNDITGKHFVCHKHLRGQGLKKYDAMQPKIFKKILILTVLVRPDAFD